MFDTLNPSEAPFEAEHGGVPKLSCFHSFPFQICPHRAGPLLKFMRMFYIHIGMFPHKRNVCFWALFESGGEAPAPILAMFERKLCMGYVPLHQT